MPVANFTGMLLAKSQRRQPRCKAGLLKPECVTGGFCRTLILGSIPGAPAWEASERLGGA